MLFKTIVQTYGTFLSAGAAPNKDPIGTIVVGPEIREFRQKALDDIGSSTVYVLDAEAADYLDSFREDVMGREFSDAANEKITAFMSEVDLPRDIIWLEYDHADLFVRRLERGHVAGAAEATVKDFGLRGFLIDNRASDHLTIKIFRSLGQKVIDPMIYLHFDKEVDGRTRFKECRFFEHPHMGLFYAHAQVGQEQFEDLVSVEFGDTSYDAVLAFMLLAVLASKDDGISSEHRASLSTKEQRTARKFGKTWLTDKVRDHIVIHIGEPGRRHLAEKAARKEFEREQAADRLAPIAHWVSEHERRYKDGTIVTVKAHRRGSRAPSSLPRLIKGPAREIV